jgi:hypothetical protein
MKAINVNSDMQNRTVHASTVDQDQLIALAVEAVARSIGLDSTAKNVTVRAYTSSYTEGSLGTAKTSVKVEITESHGAQVKGAGGVESLEG